MRKYGIDNFKFKVMLINIPKDKLDYYEILWIKKLQTLNPNGYNLSCGGTSSYPDREKGNPNMSRIPWNKGLPRSEECKEKKSEKLGHKIEKNYIANAFPGRIILIMGNIRKEFLVMEKITRSFGNITLQK